MRCLPPLAPFNVAGAFSDPACPNPLVVHPPTCDVAPKYALTADPSGGCTPVPKEIRALVPLTGTGYVQGPTGCTADEVDPTQFVEGTELPE